MKIFTSFFVFMYTYIYTYLQTHKRFPLKNKPYAAPSLAFNYDHVHVSLNWNPWRFFWGCISFWWVKPKTIKWYEAFSLSSWLKHMLINYLNYFCTALIQLVNLNYFCTTLNLVRPFFLKNKKNITRIQTKSLILTLVSVKNNKWWIKSVTNVIALCISRIAMSLFS